MGKTTLSFISFLKVLEQKSYFELNQSERRILSSQLPNGSIEAWSFVPHPIIIDEFTRPSDSNRRHIVAIETLRSEIYDAVSTFLSEQKMNVNSYFTGGSADFICDTYFTQSGFDGFMKALMEVFRKVAPEVQGGSPRNFISVFRVNSPLILCGKNLDRIVRPEPEIIEEIKSNPVIFETALRNYRSPEAIRLLGGETNMKKYLTRLKRQGVLLGYRIVYDCSKYIDRQYVPLCQATRNIPTILNKEKKELAPFLKPIVELLVVDPIEPSDQADKEVTHICINEYEKPSMRRDWRKTFYQYAGQSVNLFSFPIEGTLNETPVYISDLPELLSNAKQYAGNGMHVGNLFHPQLLTGNTVIPLSIPMDGLFFHGATFGDPGTGKTSTDLVMLRSILGRVKNVVILDNSKIVRAKLPLIPENIDQSKLFHKFEDGLSQRKFKNFFSNLLKGGLHVLECTKDSYGDLLDATIDYILDSDDATKDGAPRQINNFLLIEESQVALKGDPKRVNKLVDLLTQASRKGWCIWVSTQFPSTLGFDDKSAATVLGLLQNIVVHKINDADERARLLRVLAPSDPAKKEEISKMLETTQVNHAVVRGLKSKKNQGETLPPLMVNIVLPNNA